MSPSGMPREKSFLVGRQVLVRVVGETRQGQQFGVFHCVIETAKYGERRLSMIANSNNVAIRKFKN